MPLTPTPTVVLFVSDVQRVSTFYRELAQMRVVVQDDVHCVLAVQAFELVIHVLRGEPGVKLTEQLDPPLREDSYLKLCLPVTSIAAARVVARDHGGAIKPPAHEWEARGFRACDGHDPEGNVIQVREQATPR